jgi:hypothetical protein
MTEHAHHIHLDAPETSTRENGEPLPHIWGRCACGLERRYPVHEPTWNWSDSSISPHAGSTEWRERQRRRHEQLMSAEEWN